MAILLDVGDHCFGQGDHHVGRQLSLLLDGLKKILNALECRRSIQSRLDISVRLGTGSAELLCDLVRFKGGIVAADLLFFAEADLHLGSLLAALCDSSCLLTSTEEFWGQCPADFCGCELQDIIFGVVNLQLESREVKVVARVVGLESAVLESPMLSE